ncbi:MAG: hypothetical protein JSV21_09695 [Nitrospirota bacterium]|nr:MAG: hypothetical protein JSV21_09695 [Nitrospirota bacterium]
MNDTGARRLKEAGEFLQEAKFLLNEKLGNVHVLTKIYHSMIYGLFALFNIRSIGDLSHYELIQMFKTAYIEKEGFSPSYQEVLDLTYDLVHTCSCSDTRDIDLIDTDKALSAANWLLKDIADHLAGR